MKVGIKTLSRFILENPRAMVSLIQEKGRALRRGRVSQETLSTQARVVPALATLATVLFIGLLIVLRKERKERSLERAKEDVTSLGIFLHTRIPPKRASRKDSARDHRREKESLQVSCESCILCLGSDGSMLSSALFAS
jgi:hypothetical protein